MEIVSTIFGWLVAALSILLSLAWWIASYVVWAIIWLLLPLAIVAFIAVRAAEGVVGREAVRAWVKARALRFGAGTWDRLRPLLFAVSAAPFRVLAWFVLYTVWHAVVSLMWKPRWTPWQRAWSRRWTGQPHQKR